MNNQKKKFEDLIEKRKKCTKCNDNSLCHFESIIKDGPNLLGLWNPCNNNTHDAKILIVGQDFGIVKYLVDAINFEGLKNAEKENLTNKKLIEYLVKAGLTEKNVYFTNAILCIKNGVSKKTKNGTSMSSNVKIRWIRNCSEEFLLPLIIDHLPEVQIIITLGKYALLSIKHIAKTEIEIEKPFNRVIVKPKSIRISDKTYTLIPMLHPSFDHRSIEGHNKFDNAAESWKGLRNLLETQNNT